LIRGLHVAKSLPRQIWDCLGSAIKIDNGREAPHNRVVSLVPEGDARGRVLLSYIIDGFLLPQHLPVPNTHTNIWQSIKMADTFYDLGYTVDVISYRNSSFLPNEEYKYIIDVRKNLERLVPILNDDCIKVMHLDTANILFHNAAGARRVLQLQERRGITLRQRRFERPNRGLDYADFATIIGGDFAVSTFDYARKKLYRLPTPCGITLDWVEKDWMACRRQFLWFSSSGLVHKGLDLALEAFADMPDCRLFVCAPLDEEKDFVDAFRRELYETENIKTIGWVDVDGQEFKRIASSCVAMLHLSCSECGGTAVKICMHAGLIPIVSYESGVDVEEFGLSLRDCSPENIKDAVRYIADASADELTDRARTAWVTARNTYPRENFAAAYRKFVMELCDAESKRR
jgi:glycosyltransferase involved in cell wall biosynthesis